MKVLSRVLDLLAKSTLWTATAGLVLMTVVIAWQVFARKALNDSPAWSESLSLLLMLYFVLLAAAAGVRSGFHLRFQLLDNRLPASIASVLRGVVNTLVVFFGVLMTIHGLALAEFTSGHLIPTLGVSRALAYWPFVISGALIAVFATHNLFTDKSGKDS